MSIAWETLKEQAPEHCRRAVAELEAFREFEGFMNCHPGFKIELKKLGQRVKRGRESEYQHEGWEGQIHAPLEEAREFLHQSGFPNWQKVDYDPTWEAADLLMVPFRWRQMKHHLPERTLDWEQLAGFADSVDEPGSLLCLDDAWLERAKEAAELMLKQVEEGALPPAKEKDFHQHRESVEAFLKLCQDSPAVLGLAECNQPDNLYALEGRILGSAQTCVRWLQAFGCPPQEAAEYQHDGSGVDFEAGDSWHGQGEVDLRELADFIAVRVGGFFEVEIGNEWAQERLRELLPLELPPLEVGNNLVIFPLER